MTGGVYHYAVFLDQVHVPKDSLLGKAEAGCTHRLAGLDTDRFWGRFSKSPALTRNLAQLVVDANTTVRRGQPLARDPVVRRQLATIATDTEVLRMLFYRHGWLIQEGLPTPYASAMHKGLADETGQQLAALGMALLGLYGPRKAGSRWAQLHGDIQHLDQTTMGHTIAGGTSEVLHTTVAMRGLGLPREPRGRSGA